MEAEFTSCSCTIQTIIYAGSDLMELLGRATVSDFRTAVNIMVDCSGWNGTRRCFWWCPLSWCSVFLLSVFSPSLSPLNYAAHCGTTLSTIERKKKRSSGSFSSPASAFVRLCLFHCLIQQAENVFVWMVCLFVCLSVSKIAENAVDEWSWNFCEVLALAKTTNFFLSEIPIKLHPTASGVLPL